MQGTDSQHAGVDMSMVTHPVDSTAPVVPMHAQAVQLHALLATRIHAVPAPCRDWHVPYERAAVNRSGVSFVHLFLHRAHFPKLIDKNRFA